MDEPALRKLWETTLGPEVDLDALDPGATQRAAAAAAPTVDVPPPAPGAPQGRLARGYELLGELARGGMGIVHRARQRSLGREVALKKVLEAPSSEETRVRRERFLAEARITAALDHPNVVPVHDLVEGDEGETLLAMKLVGGRSWKAVLHGDGPRDERAEIGVLLAVANAIGYAHARGVIHRDLKPENVMVGEFGEVLVMDWGLALVLAEPRERAVAGGTPAYMAPELAEARLEDVGPWTDVYLLGAMLHEIVTGRPPHARASVVAALAAASASAPPVFAGDVPGELQAVCRRALARAPGERFPSASAFRGALEAYLEHRESLRVSDEADRALSRASAAPRAAPREEVYAHLADAIAGFRQARVLWPGNDRARTGEERARVTHAELALEAGDLGVAAAHVGALETTSARRAGLVERVGIAQKGRAQAELSSRRLRRWIRVMGAAIGLILSAGSAITGAAYRRAELERRRAEVGRLEAELQRAWALHDAGTDPEIVAVAAAGAWSLAAIASETGDGEIASLIAQARSSAELLVETALTEPFAAPLAELGHEDSYRCFAVAPDGGLLVGGDRFLTLFSLATGRATRVFDGPRGHVESCAFSLDGREVLAAGEDGVARVWDRSSGRLEASLVHDSIVTSCGWSPDGRSIVTAARDGIVRVWDRASGALLASRVTGGDWLAARFSPGGGDVVIAVTSSTGTELVLEDRALSGRRWSLGVGSQACEPVFSPDGALVAVGPDDGSGPPAGGSFLLVERATGTPRRLPIPERPLPEHHPRELEEPEGGAVAFSPDGSRVAGTNGWRVVVWDRGSGSVLLDLEPKLRIPPAIAFTPDGSELVLMGTSGVLELRDASTGKVTRRLGRQPLACSCAYSGDGKRIATGYDDGSLVVWDRETRRELRTFPLTGGVRACALSADGREVLAGSDDGTLVLHAVGGGGCSWTFRAPTGRVIRCAFPASGRLVLAGTGPLTGSGAVWLLDRSSGRVERTIESDRTVDDVAISSDGGRVADAAGGKLEVLETATGARLWSVEPEKRLSTCAFAPDGRLVVAAEGRELVLRDAATGAVRHTYPGDGSLACAFSSDGAIVAGVESFGELVVWEWRSGSLVRSFSTDRRGIACAALAPDGREAVVAGLDALATRVWATGVQAPERVLASPRPDELAVRALAPSGTVLAAVGSTTVALLDPRTGETRRTLGPVTPASTLDAVVRFSPGGEELLVETTSGIARFSVATGRPLGSFEVPGGALVCHASGETLAVAGKEGALVRLDRTSGSRIASSSWNPAKARSGAFSPDGALFVSAHEDRRLRIWPLSGEPRSIDAGPVILRSCAVSPDGRLVAAGCFERKLELLELATGSRVLTLEPAGGPVDACAFSPDGRLLLARLASGDLELWDPLSGHRIRTLECGPLPWPPVAELTLDGTILAPVGPDLVVRVSGLPVSLDTLLPDFARDPVESARRAVANRRRHGGIRAPTPEELPSFERP